jgi:Fur family peroxide stress response transcriptional regulator
MANMESRARHAIQRLEASCRDQGIPLTEQRRVILCAISGRKDHPTADEIYETVREQAPQISRTTVYRTLDLYVRLGLITRIAHPGSTARYDPDTRQHHHLLCLHCNKLTDLYEPHLDALPLHGLLPEGFKALDYSVLVRGICPDCLKDKESRQEPRRSADLHNPAT